MKKDIDLTRVPVDDIAGKFPNLYRELKSKGVAATITLFSKKASAQVYESQAGTFTLVYGSRSLAIRAGLLEG